MKAPHILLSVTAALLMASCSPPERVPDIPVPTPVPTPHPATGATDAATRLYPDLKKIDSTFNRTFRDLYADRVKSDPVFLSRAEWPLDLARQTAAMLGVPAYSATPPPVSPTPTPTWFEQRAKESGSILNAPPHSQTRSVSHRIYGTDPYGQYWVDQENIRHYTNEPH